ncbi:hypothetical protein [Paenibacillus mucilaginosus]|uniref:hypothetical protein n=1 Tax=Paenibacillus mucilaginosus TaxID=61624 RepID=UPI003D244F92
MAKQIEELNEKIKELSQQVRMITISRVPIHSTRILIGRSAMALRKKMIISYQHF